MKRFLFAIVVLLGLTISCAPTATPQPQVGLATATTQAVTATATTTPTNTLTTTATSTPTSTSTPTVTRSPSPTPQPPTVTPSPKPTVTARPEITPIPFSSVRNIDVSSIPPEVFSRENIWRDVGDYRFSVSGEVGDQTTFEPLPSYRGFDGAVVHVKVVGPPPKFGMQRSYVAIERNQRPLPKGPWAYEASYIVLQAPKNLVNHGWMGYSIAVLDSIGMHVDRDDGTREKWYRAAGGVRLWYDQSSKEFRVSSYIVNPDLSTSDLQGSVPFVIGVKQGLRLEFFYDNGIPSIRTFLIKFTDGGKQYVLIAQGPVAPDLNPIRGEISFLGTYTGYPVKDYEVISGEARIFR